jgi:hypothetical protein
MAAVCSLIVLAMACLGGAGAVAAPVDSSAAPVNLPTLAYYYQWFVPSAWNRAKTDYPLAGRYSSDDESIMRRHIDEAKQAGIDGFIVSWKSSPVNNRRLETLMRVAEDTSFKLAVIYQGLNFERDPLPVSRIAADFDLFNRTYAPNPVFKIFDRPLLIWSGTWKFSAADLERTTQPYRSSLLVLATEKSTEGYERVSASFDGDAYYWSSVDPATNPGYRAKLKAMSTTVHNLGGIWIAPFAPGFDARMVGGTREVLRRDGATLRTEYDAAISSSPDALGLISWNEFSENTHVEPSEQHGYTALTALANLTDGRRVPVSPLATDSSEQASENEGAMTVLSGIAVLLLLFVGVTVFNLTRRRSAQSNATEPAPSRPAGITLTREFLLPKLLIVAVLTLGIILVIAVSRLGAASRDATQATPLYLGTQPVKDANRAVVAAAGDISCPADKARLGEKTGPKSCRMQQTADLVNKAAPDAVLALGDLQYPSGSLDDFMTGYERNWGAFRNITYPVPGNHEYGTPRAAGYYSYFGSRAGDPNRGYYSFDVGSWHVVALNSECQHVGGCSETSPQATWLKGDLAAHPRDCTLAYWHRPRFSSGAHGNNLDNEALWRIAVGAGVDLVINGHDHDYERFAPLNADGDADAENGTTEIVVGTGGASHYRFHLPPPTSVARVQDENGILRLELADGDYSWAFLQAPENRVLDAGSAQCH